MTRVHRVAQRRRHRARRARQVVRINERARALLGVRDAAPLPARAPAARRVAARGDRRRRSPATTTRRRGARSHERTVASRRGRCRHGGAVLDAARPHAAASPRDDPARLRRERVARAQDAAHRRRAASPRRCSTTASRAEQRRRFVETIRDNATRMQRIVDDLLDLSRIESGGWRPNVAHGRRRAASCSDVFTAIAAARPTREAARRSSPTIAPDATRVRADPTALRQVAHQPRRERGAVHARGQRHAAHARGRRRRVGRRARHRHRHRRRAPAAHLRALLSRRRRPLARARAARGSGWRSCGTSSRRTAAASRRERRRAAARRSACSCRPELAHASPANRYSNRRLASRGPLPPRRTFVNTSTGMALVTTGLRHALEISAGSATLYLAGTLTGRTLSRCAASAARSRTESPPFASICTP